MAFHSKRVPRNHDAFCSLLPTFSVIRGVVAFDQFDNTYTAIFSLSRQIPTQNSPRINFTEEIVEKQIDFGMTRHFSTTHNVNN